MIKKIIILFVVIFLIAIGYLYMQSSSSEAIPNIPIVEENKTSTSDGSTNENNGLIKEFTITSGNFSFMPETLTVNEGDIVRIVIKNETGFHDFVIDEFFIKTNPTNGEGDSIVEFIADKTGSFEYYCSIGTHRQMGMKGTLIVQ
jgi:plastocyanin